MSKSFLKHALIAGLVAALAAPIIAAPAAASSLGGFGPINVSAWRPGSAEKGLGFGLGGHAASERQGFGVNVGVSTLGATVEPVYRFNDRFGVRGLIGKGDVDFETELDDVDYEVALKTGGVGLLADFYPTGRAFHLSAGLIKTDYSASMNADGASLGFATANLHVDVTQARDLNPYLGLGYEGNVGKHATVSFAAGAILFDGFEMKGSSTTPGVTQAHVDDFLADTREDLKGVKALPFAKLAVGVRF